MFLPSKMLPQLGRLRPNFGSGARSHKQALARWSAAIAYTVLSIGLPIPAGGLPVTDETFPCMHHRCGCHSAEKCWRDCCCMSFAQKLAWAKQNNVTPPQYVLAEARSRDLLDSPSPKSDCCCKAPRVKSCCEPQDTDCCGTQKAAKQSRAKSTPAGRRVVLIEAMKCRGVGDNWLGVGVSLPPVTVELDISVRIVARLSEPSLQFCSWVASPPIPPPRSCAA